MYRNKAWWRDYSLFLQSPRWRVVRAQVLARDGYRCQYCQARAEHVHHLSYSRLDDPAVLVSVCTACRLLLHHRALSPYSGSQGAQKFWLPFSFRIAWPLRAKSFPRIRWWRR